MLRSFSFSQFYVITSLNCRTDLGGGAAPPSGPNFLDVMQCLGAFHLILSGVCSSCCILVDVQTLIQNKNCVVRYILTGLQWARFDQITSSTFSLLVYHGPKSATRAHPWFCPPLKLSVDPQLDLISRGHAPPWGPNFL